MFSLISDEIWLNIDNNTTDGFCRLNCQIQINLKRYKQKKYTSLLKIFNGFLTFMALVSIVPGLARLINLLNK